MRVAISGNFWDQPRTGTGQYLRHLWDALPESAASSTGDTFTLLLPSQLSPNEPIPTGLERRIVRSASLHSAFRIPHSALDKLAWEQWGVVRAARQQRAQLLHIPYLAAPFVHPCPTVVTAHDMIPWVVPGYKGSRAVRLYLAVAAAAVKRARLIMADSEASRRDVIRVLKVSPNRVRTVYLGMEPHPDYSWDQLEDVRSRFGLPGRFAFYLGGFDLRKNVPRLLQAWNAALGELCPDSEPVLAIGGAIPEPGGVFPDVRGEAHRLGFDGERGPVRFLGRISEEDKPILMAAAHLFVYPSAYEGFGLDPLEAMSVGCPVVSSSGGSLAEVVGDGGLLVPPGDTVALSRAIVRAWQDGTLRQQLAERGRRRAASFTWQRTAEQTSALYRRSLIT